MALSLIAQPEAQAVPGQELPAVTATELVSGMQKVARAVMRHGAVLITKHDEPAMVLMSIEHYRALEQAGEPDLTALTERFDAMYADMQARGAARRMSAAFAAGPAELGAAAVAAAQEGRAVRRAGRAPAAAGRRGAR